MYETFQQIEEGDKLLVEHSAKTMEMEAWIVTGEDEEKVVAFDITQTRPRLVIKYGDVYMETRALGHSREWTNLVKVQKLERLE